MISRIQKYKNKKVRIFWEPVLELGPGLAV